MTLKNASKLNVMFNASRYKCRIRRKSRGFTVNELLFYQLQIMLLEISRHCGMENI